MTDHNRPNRPARPVVLVTGLSGAGRSTALHLLEDLGFEALDNLPLRFLPPLIDDDSANARPLAVGIDSRTRGFDPEALISLLDRLETDRRLHVTLIFMEADDETLVERYSETRRRHPLATDRPLSESIARERRLLAPLRERAARTYDTSHLTIGHFKALLETDFANPGGRSDPLRVLVMSFGFKHGLPREANLVFDVRFLKNPHYDPVLRPQTGLDPAVGAMIRQDPDWTPFLARVTALLDLLIPRYRDEGKSTLTVAVGCTGGRHRSVFVAMQIADWLSKNGCTPRVFHRDIRSRND